MLILDATIVNRRTDADFGRVEAVVDLLVKTHAGQPPHRLRVRTSQPLAGDAPLDQRLTEDAGRLARALHAARPAPLLRAA